MTDGEATRLPPPGVRQPPRKQSAWWRCSQRPGGDVLEVSLATGGVLGHFDPLTDQLVVIDPQDSLAVAAAVAPYLLGREQPLGVLSPRHVAAADVLWEILEASPFTWQRFVPLHDRLLFFYCPLAHLALEIVDDGEAAVDVEAPNLAPRGGQRRDGSRTRSRRTPRCGRKLAQRLVYAPCRPQVRCWAGRRDAPVDVDAPDARLIEKTGSCDC